MLEKIWIVFCLCLGQFESAAGQGPGTGGVATVYNVGFGNTCFVRNGALGIIIDAGGDYITQATLDEISASSLGITKLLILATHTHADHMDKMATVMKEIATTNPNGYTSFTLIGKSPAKGATVSAEWIDAAGRQRIENLTEAEANQKLAVEVGDGRVRIVKSWNDKIGGKCPDVHKDNMLVRVEFLRNDGTATNLVFMGDACGGPPQFYVRNPHKKAEAVREMQRIMDAIINPNDRIHFFIAPHHGSNGSGEFHWYQMFQQRIQITILSTLCGTYRGVPSAEYTDSAGTRRCTFCAAGTSACANHPTEVYTTEDDGDQGLIRDFPPPTPPLQAHPAQTAAAAAGPSCLHSPGEDPLKTEAEEAAQSQANQKER